MTIQFALICNDSLFPSRSLSSNSKQEYNIVFDTVSKQVSDWNRLKTCWHWDFEEHSKLLGVVGYEDAQALQLLLLLQWQSIKLEENMALLAKLIKGIKKPPFRSSFPVRCKNPSF